LPGIENEVHRALKDAADQAAIRVFAENVRRLLLEAPFGPKPVLGIDPGIRTGCKLAAVDAAGAFVKSDVIHLHTEEGRAAARARLAEMGKDAQAVAVGNGTAGRETEVFARAALSGAGLSAPAVLVSEAGAGVCRASGPARAALLDVKHCGARAFEQAAGFLRGPGSANPLDNTGIHPETYPVLQGLAARLGRPVSEVLGPGVELLRSAPELKEEVGAFTFEDILRELEKPGRDPRDRFVPFSFREDVRALADLKPGLVCPGVVTNVTNFGAFVDVGVHQDGLVHISQLGDRFVK